MMDDSPFREKLREESRLWENEGLISSNQRETILQRYVIPAITPTDSELTEHTAASREFPLYIRVVLALAVFLVGMAVFLLISFNWKYMPGAAKLTIVGGVLAAAHVGGFWLRKTGWKNWADAAFFFAGIMYGVGIWQVGQVFHLPADFPMGIWLWAVGVFLMAVVLGSTPLHLLSVALLTTWVIAALTGSLNMGQVFWFGLMPFSAPSLPIFAVVGIGVGLVRKNRVVATLYTLLFLFWWITQGVGCGLGTRLTFHIVAVGMICMAIFTGLRSKNFHDATLGRLGVLLVLGGLFAPSFLYYWGELLYGNNIWNRYRVWSQPIVFLFWGLAIPLIDYAVLTALFRFSNRKESIVERIRNNKVVVLSALTVLVLWLGSFGLSLYLGSSGNYSSYRYYNTIRLDPLAIGGMLLTNTLIVTLTIWLIITGLKQERGDWFWSGVLFFLFWAVVRYVDLFSGFGGMLGAAAIFLFCGLFMLGIVYVWSTRARKKALENITPPPEDVVDSMASDRFETVRNRLALFWQSERNILTAIVIVALLQFAVLGAMIVNEMRPHLSGTTIRVTTVPVDPRDLFRGDYVILRYEFSSLGTIPNSSAFQNDSANRTVYVTMRQEGDLWKATGISRSRPKDGVFLRGIRKSYGYEIEYGIESYFVQEGTGKAIEDAMRGNRKGVVVELTVAPNGKASIKTVHVQ